MLILLCSTVFSTNIIAARLSGQLYDPFLMTLCRWAFVGLGLSPFVLFASSKRLSLSAADLYNIALYAVFGLLLPSVLTFLAGLTTTALNLTIIYSSTPAVIYIMAAITGAERIKLWQLVGLLISTLGVITALGYSRGIIPEFAIREGDVFAVTAVFNWAFYSVYIAGKRPTLALSTRLWLASWVCTAVLFCYVLATGRLGGLSNLTAGFFSLTAFVALVPSVLGYMLHAHLTRAVGVVRVGLMSYLVPVAAGIQAMLLLSEPLYPAQLAAAGMILLGVWISGR
ncbi:DMT family transporter [Microvirga zambiensis]|uniref:DMT family transporter n=1 Tax=Microvirga zambiensis TaxID=1402137 RepID=UPI00191EC24F|nr:DMT family transporter [Microvirga zambiensis]